MDKFNKYEGHYGIWHKEGYPLGTENAVLVETLQLYASKTIDMKTLANLFNVTTAWGKHVRLEITTPTAGIRLMNMNCSQNSAITNLSGAASN